MTYGGDVTPKECWDMLSEGDGAVLIDVRTQAEWTFVGMPSLGSKMTPLIAQQWQAFPHMMVDQNFADQVSGQLEDLGASKETRLCFLCRSGVRSLAAAQAMSQAGYPNTYNVTGGFEGDPDNQGHRGHVNGWKADGLPWRQG